MLLLHTKNRRALENAGGGTAPLLLGVGSAANSSAYPKISNTTVGDWYVNGSVSSSGDGTTLGTAFKTIQEGLSALQDGQTLLVKGGTYNLTSRLNRTSSWTTGVRIMGYGNDRPVLTAVGFTTANDAPLRFQTSSAKETWHRFYLRDVTGSGQQGIMSAGQNITISDFWVSHVITTGVYTTQGGSGTVVKDTVVWHLGDGISQGTNTGDCFAATAWTLSEYTDTVFARCVAINGPDDNYDLWGGYGAQFLDCVSINSGKYWNGNPGSSSGGDGSGFKMGGGGNGNGHNNIARGCIAIGSRTNGFQHNYVAGNANHTFTNNTAVNCTSIGFDYGGGSTTTSNLSIGNGSTHYTGSGGTVQNNSWQLGVTDPSFGSPSTGDYSLLSASSAIGAGVGGTNLGASTVALELAKTWLNRDVTGYADPSW